MSVSTAASARRFGPASVRRSRASGHAAALAAAVAAFALVLAGLLATHHATRLALPPGQAVAALRADQAWRAHLSGARVTRVQVMPLDSRYDQLIVYDGLRMIYQADVSSRGTVVGVTDLRGSKSAFGSAIANDPGVLALLSLTFVLVTAVWPLWRLRNLDVLVAVSLVASVPLLNDTLPLVAIVYPALAYLGLRAAVMALGRSGGAAPSAPLLDRLTPGWTFARRRRLLRLVAGAAALIVAMVGLSSLHVVDVGYAVMEGATALVHGVLPYGHVPDILHGDTYPLGSYLLYVPFAWVDPVHTAWDNADFTLVVAVVAAVLIAIGLARSHRPAGEHAERHELNGLRAAIAWLTFPTVLLAVSTGTTDLVLGAVLVGAVLVWRRPAASTTILAAGAWFKLLPIALLPVTLARLRGPARARAMLGVAAVSAPMVALLVGLGGIRGPVRMIHALAFQSTRSSPHELWTVVGSVPLQQIAQALTAALIVGGAVRVARDGALARDRTRMAALFAAVLLGLQVSANYWSSFYLSWVIPLLAVSLLTNGVERPTT